MNQPEQYTRDIPKEIISVHESENHHLRNSLMRKLDFVIWSALIAPGYAGTGILGFGGGLDENIRNISFGMITWTLVGAGLVYFTPKVASKGYSMLTQSPIFHRFLDKLGVLEDIHKLSN